MVGGFSFNKIFVTNEVNKNCSMVHIFSKKKYVWFKFGPVLSLI